MISNFRWLLGVTILFMIMSCSSKPIIDGDQVTPPYGYVDFCKNNPESVFCKEIKH